jgi:SAM-dependent methyltransferase
MTRSLPSRPSLDHLKNQAKALLRAHRSGDRQSCPVLRNLPRLAEASDEQTLAATLTLADVQHALAREYGFESWPKLKQRLSQLAPPMRVNPPRRWYHGSPKALDVLAAGSTVTPIPELARAFAHRPGRVDIKIHERGEEEIRRTVEIEHNGQREGFLYEVEVTDEATDLRPHPESTMSPGEEMLTTRDLPLRCLAVIPADESVRQEFEDGTAGRDWARSVFDPDRMRNTAIVSRVILLPGLEPNWPASSVGKLRKEGTIPRRWDRVIEDCRQSPRREVADALAGASATGAVLEVGMGPGGGFMPAVLDRNPSARIIANDLSPAVLSLWGEFLHQRGLGRNVVLASFDRAAMPLRTGSVAAVSSVLGLGDAKGLAEGLRVLAPGGLLASWEIVVDPHEWASLPQAFRDKWEKLCPSLTAGLLHYAQREGMEILLHQVLPGRALVPDEGGLPREADQLGVTLHVTYEHLLARRRP